MTFSSMWLELEDEKQPEGAGRLRRRVFAESELDIYVDLILPERARAVSLSVEPKAVAGVDELPQARGLEHVLHEGSSNGPSTLTLSLVDPAAVDIFGVLAEDVAQAASGAADSKEGVGIWTGRVARWQRLLRNAPHGLTEELQRALYSELWVLRELLVPRSGFDTAVRAWTGPSRTSKDFQLDGGALEVKSCAANQPQVVIINGERQLDDAGVESLHLIHVSLDVLANGPETLMQMVTSVRETAKGTSSETELEEALFSYGFLDAHAARYERVGYAVRENRIFRVGEGFPRLIEAQLPDGVGRVRYKLVIAACAPFEVDKEAMLQVLGVGG